MYQEDWNPLLFAAVNDRIPIVEYLVERGVNIEAKDKVSDVISLMWSHTYVTHAYICVWMYQHTSTPLLHAAERGHLPVVEYLVEKGANMEAENEVSYIISLMWNRT